MCGSFRLRSMTIDRMVSLTEAANLHVSNWRHHTSRVERTA